MRKLQQRAINVLQFLRAMQEMRARPVRDVTNYPEVLWLDDIQADDPKTACAWNSDLEDKEGLWLSLARVDRTPPPTLPEILEPWVPHADVQDSTLVQPHLLDEAEFEVEVEGTDGELVLEFRDARLLDHPEVVAEWERWLSSWQAWAEDDRESAPLRVPYQKLYAMFQAQRAEPERLEVVLGLGLLSTTSERAVRRHVISARAAINLDLDTGQLDVRLDPEESQLHLEEDMLATRDRVPQPVAEQIQASLTDLAQLFGEDSVEPFIREWTNAFSSDAVYRDVLSPTTVYGTTVTFAPALILRQRGRQSFLQAIQTVEDCLNDGAEVPPVMRQLLDDPDALDASDVRSGTSEGGLARISVDADSETYFFKPANPQQLEVSDRLREHGVIVVQGPPGTGKTHTIANLTTDLLAHGKRVLVTSHSSQALKVIRDMLPDEVRDLCVSLTDTSVKGQQDLKRSVNTIINETTGRTIAELDDEHRAMRHDLAVARDAKELALDGLRKIREQETMPAEISKGTYSGTPQQIAQQVLADEDKFKWIGEINFAAPRATNHEFGRLVSLLSLVTEAVRGDAQPVPKSSDLMDPEEFRHALDERARLSERLSRLDNAEPAIEIALAEVDPRTVDELRRVVESLTFDLEPLLATGHPWIPHVIGDLWNGREALAHQRESESQAAVDAIARDLTFVGSGHVTGLEHVEISSAAGKLHALAAHLAGGGALRKLGRAPAPVRACQSEIALLLVDGRPITGPAEAAAAAAACSAEMRLQHAERLWSQQLSGSQGMRAAQLADMTEALSRLLRLKPTVDGLRTLARRLPGLTNAPWSDPTWLRQLAGVLERDTISRALSAIDARFEATASTLSTAQRRRGAHTAVDTTFTAVNDRAPAAYSAAWASLAQAEEANLQLAELKALSEKLTMSLPDVASELSDGNVDAVWKSRAAQVEDAYIWAEWDEWLRDIVDPSEEAQLRDDLDKARMAESRALRHIAANRAWRYCQSRMTGSERQNLRVYATAMNKIGKGTGKTAPRYRAQARVALEKAQSAVPAWIMSLQSVVDSVPFTQAGAFDVVIVDEASQSGHEALLLTWLANQMLVVGDAEQISPDNVGIDVDGVFHLQDELLVDVPRVPLYGPNNSFLEHAEAIAPAPIMLREHFRCMPEIIEFSNRLSYDRMLMPVRQHGLERLAPLRRTYVSDAVVRGGPGRQLNAAEAEQIVETIAKCCTDPAYEHTDGRAMSMGVITMLGGAQHKHINDLVLDRLGVEEFERRHFLVSGPAAFQGDERDVIFMSLVASPHGAEGRRRIGALARREHQQRLNVAASRARDQVWVFHSVLPEELPSGDLRKLYLEYLTDDVGDAHGVVGEPTAQARPDAFGSLLEQHLYVALSERGYHVRPHAKAAGYHIDLVVVGTDQQLAIECDGDEIDASDSENQDMRQGDLERLGWQFWRIRGSQYFRDPEGSLLPLWERLNALGIWPLTDGVATLATISDVVAAPPVPVEETTSEPEVDISAPVDEPTAESVSGAAHAVVDTSPPAHAQLAPQQHGVAVGKQSYERLQLEFRAITERLDRSALAASDHQLRANEGALAHRIGELRERRAWLRQTLEDAHVVSDDYLPDVIWPGAIVKLRDGTSGEIDECYFASVNLGDDSLQRYGPDSPVGRMVAGAQVGQRLSYTRSDGTPANFEVLGVSD